MRKNEVVIFWNNKFIGDDDEFNNLLAHQFYFRIDHSSSGSNETQGKLERSSYFSRDSEVSKSTS